MKKYILSKKNEQILIVIVVVFLIGFFKQPQTFIGDIESENYSKDKDQAKPSALVGMIAWYKFDGNNSDLSGNGLDLTGGTGYYADDRYGNFNMAFRFTSGMMTCENFPVLNESFTVTYWTKFHYDYTAVSISQGNDLETSFQWHVGFGPGGTYIKTPDQGWVGGSTIFNYEWVQFTYVFSTHFLFFRNGILIMNLTRNNYPLLNGEGDRLMVGGYYADGRVGSFSGLMDDVRIWSRALTDTEAQQLYNDTDNDRISDWDELNYYSTNYLNNDSDNDNMIDGWEVHNGLNPLYGADNVTDRDSDFLSNVLEFQFGTNPNLNDTDSDGLFDGDEVLSYFTDPLDSDTDKDELNDGLEILVYLSNPLVNDTDSDSLLDGIEVNFYNSSPTNNDTDADKMPDGWEALYGLNLTSSLDNETDNDLDDLINVLEYFTGTNPNNNDTDNDNLSDGFEFNILGTNPLDSDTDEDIMTDDWEYFNGLDPLSFGEQFLDYDNDGLMNLIEFKVNSDPNNVDTDGDGYSDEDEVADFSDPSDPLDIPIGLGETTANIPFYLNEMYTDPYMHSRPSTINYDYTTAFYKYDNNVDAFVTKRWAPYTGSAVFVSNELLAPNYFVTSARVIILAKVPIGTSIDIYITNNYFKKEHKIYNNTKVNFQVYGRQLALKIVLKSTDPAVTPLFYGFTISSVGIKYNESKFSYNRTYHLLPSSKNEFKTNLKTMTFTYSGHTMRYAFEWRFERLQINKTHDTIRCYIYVRCISTYLVAYQNNYFKFDLNTTINGVNFRFFKVKGFQTPYITSGKLAERTLFNMVIEHDVWEKIILNASISYRAWNYQGGDVTGSASISIEFYQNGPEPDPIDDEIDLIIPGYNIIFIFGILVISLFCLIIKKKFCLRT